MVPTDLELEKLDISWKKKVVLRFHDKKNVKTTSLSASYWDGGWCLASMSLVRRFPDMLEADNESRPFHLRLPFVK